MAILNLKESEEMADRLLDVFARASSTAISEQIREDTQAMVEGQVSDGVVLILFTESVVDKCETIWKTLNRISETISMNTMFLLGVMLGMRYAYDHGTLDCVVRAFADLPMFKNEGNDGG